MNYQVLARKYRPRSFRELVGQEHVAKALINALDQNRLHHAYLFTGTRGVGKTTIARILAKCLNCETGISSEPCGVCPTCTEINEGRYVDLIEIDAASRTKVEDTREILDNVQYAPTRGRYKVYLIDEVHMLSNSSFNALLKTLEEPPPHVKFLLATTDPHKLPVTILSRCLQFSLKAMSPERVVNHLRNVLDQEMVAYDEGALWELGRAANGSMRDALSLTDQAIAFGNGRLGDADVRSMLGTIDRDLVFRVLEAVNTGEAGAIIDVVFQLAEQSVDFGGALAELVSLLHRVAVAQLMPDAVDNSMGDRDRVLALAQVMTAEDVQLYYQIALQGRKDLPYAFDQRSGFEMTLIRMLAFRPLPAAPQAGQGGRQAPVSGSRPSAPAPRTPAGPVASSPVMAAPVVAPSASAPVSAAGGLAQARAALASAQTSAAVGAPVSAPTLPEPSAQPAVVRQSDPQPASNVVPIRPEPVAAPVAAAPVAAPEPLVVRDGEWTADQWARWVRESGMTGAMLNLARHGLLVMTGDQRYELQLSPSNQMLGNAAHIKAIEEKLSQAMGVTIRLELSLLEPSGETPVQIAARIRKERLEKAEASLRSDPNVQLLVRDFGAQLIVESIQPID